MLKGARDMFSDSVQVRDGRSNHDLKEVLEAFNPTSPKLGSSISYEINYTDLQLGKELGRGSYAVVYQGTWRKHTGVAVKQLLSGDISEEAKKEFEAESQTMAGLRSPYIVQFYGYCVSPKHCIVMEHMPNGSLFDVLKDKKQPLDWAIRIRIAIEIASGVAFLHQEHIIHRDIKSLNVLLDRSYGAKLADFGLAKVKIETKSHIMTTKAGGTIAWMAPELFRRQAVYSQKSDIYSLGITFWELAARKVPYSGEVQEAISTFVRDGEREDIPKDCPPKLASLITACWAGPADKRPDADSVVTYLKSDQTNFAQFLKQNATTLSQKVSTRLPSQSAAKPIVQPPQVVNPNPIHAAPKVLPSAAVPIAKVSPPLIFLPAMAKPDPRVTGASELRKLQGFLKAVVGGEQDKAETILKRDPALAVVSIDVTDLSKRTFKNVTGLQYALWALDWHMWTMLLKYMTPEVVTKQIAESARGLWVTQHGVTANWENLIQALNQYVSEVRSNKPSSTYNQTWIKQVGGAQLLVPAHVVNEYCYPSRPFYPTPDFTQSAIAGVWRSCTTDEGEWFSAKYNGGPLGEGFAVCRGGNSRAVCTQPGRDFGAECDSIALTALLKTRQAQRDAVVAQYLSTSKLAEPLTVQSPVVISAKSLQDASQVVSSKINPSEQKNPFEVGMLMQFQGFNKPSLQESTSELKELGEFLRLVAEGEQNEAEKMLKINPVLALASGDVTDLSKRSFTNITAFQYAVWALDWHMWTMIRKYLPDEELKRQAEGFETGAWVKGSYLPWREKHGIHAQYLIDNLVNALQVTIDLYKFRKRSEAKTAWLQQVGGAQLLVPAHVVNEYCYTERPFYPSPNFKDSLTLPRRRIVDEECKDWFAVLGKSSKFGDKFAIYRSTKEKCKVVSNRDGTPYYYQAQPPRVYYEEEGLYRPSSRQRNCVECRIRKCRCWNKTMEILSADRDSVCALSNTRIAQREELINELRPKSVQKKGV